MRFRWQNITREDGPTGRRRFPRNGRCWLYHGGSGSSIGFEWCFGPALAIGVTCEPCEREVTFRLAPLFVALYLTAPMPRWLRRRIPGRWGGLKSRPVWIPERRELSLAVHHGCLWWCLWRDDGVWEPGDWRQGSFGPARLLLGSRNHSKEILCIESVGIPMKEQHYPAIVELVEATWRWQRWPWWPLTRRRRLAEVEIPEGIPHPGKGENSWDCGEDATYGLSCAAHTVEEAVCKVMETVLRKRRRYGGPDWAPQGR